jgi:hypothetical protein
LFLTKSDLVPRLGATGQQVHQQLSDCLQCEPYHLPVMLVSARADAEYNNLKGNRAVEYWSYKGTVGARDRIKHNGNQQSQKT